MAHLRNHPDEIFKGPTYLSIIRRRLECDGATTDVLEQLIDWYPEALAFSILLAVVRFPPYSESLVDKVIKAIEQHSKAQTDYCNQKFNGDKNKPSTADKVIGEAMTLIFSFFDDFVPTPQSGNLSAIHQIRQKYPKSILYVDSHGYTPLHGVCCSMNMNIFRYFIEWHLEENPSGRGGLYEMNDSGITPLDTLIDTQNDITPALKWLCEEGLLRSSDVKKWRLIHRAAHSSSIETIRFFIDMFPIGVLSMDDDFNLPINLHLGLRYRQQGIFSEKDLAIVQLLVREGIANGGINTIGGLFHQDPDEDNLCTLDTLLNEVGEARNRERIWQMIDDCCRERGDYVNAPIVHAAILNRDHISDELFMEVLDRYGENAAAKRNEYGQLPLSHALKVGAKWENCVSHILALNHEALDEIDDETGLPIVAYAASREKSDMSSIYMLLKMSPANEYKNSIADDFVDCVHNEPRRTEPPLPSDELNQVNHKSKKMRCDYDANDDDHRKNYDGHENHYNSPHHIKSNNEIGIILDGRNATNENGDNNTNGEDINIENENGDGRNNKEPKTNVSEENGVSVFYLQTTFYDEVKQYCSINKKANSCNVSSKITIHDRSKTLLKEEIFGMIHKKTIEKVCPRDKPITIHTTMMIK
jgi:hypothetical protein